MSFNIFRCPQMYIYLLLYFIGLIVYYSVVASLKVTPYYLFLIHLVFNLSMIIIFYILCRYDYNLTSWSIVLFPIIYFTLFIIVVINSNSS